MSDLREKIIDILHDKYVSVCMDEVNDDADEIISLCQPQWIKRSDRNPKKRGRYLTYKAGVDEMQFANFGTSAGWENSRNLGVDNVYRVTHWMPLPESPSE